MIIKRIFDLCLATPGLIMALPLMLFISIWIKFDSRGSIFFRQTRVGRYEKLFYIYKFRTMVNGSDQLGNLITIEQDHRITALGSFLRKYKLDELPQLINVIKGEMSLVGPRPEVPQYVEKYPPEIKKIVFSVPPGITDFASIKYKDESKLLSFYQDPERFYVEEVLPDKLNLYLHYVRERNLWMDFKLILISILAIFKSGG